MGNLLSSKTGPVNSTVNIILIQTYLFEWCIPLLSIYFYAVHNLVMFLILSIICNVLLVGYFIVYIKSGRSDRAVRLPLIVMVSLSTILLVTSIVMKQNLCLVAPAVFLFNSILALVVTFLQTIIETPRYILPFAMVGLGVVGMLNGFMALQIVFCVYSVIFIVVRAYYKSERLSILIYLLLGFVSYQFASRVDYSVVADMSTMFNVAFGFLMVMVAILFSALVKIKVVQQYNKDS